MPVTILVPLHTAKALALSLSAINLLDNSKAVVRGLFSACL
jgi:hypothetical protein